MMQPSPQPNPDWPTPAPSERPTGFADRMGGWYASRQSARHRKEHGLYLTPAAVASYMAQTVDVGGSKLRILDPAAGAGVLCCAVVEALANRSSRTGHAKPTRIELVAHEVDGGLVPSLRAVLGYLAAWSRRRGVAVEVDVVGDDFIAAHAGAVRANGDLLPAGLTVAAFDVVIANPPYFKLAKTDPRALALPEVVHGQPNIYALFMAVSAALLRQGGQLVFITPRSFASGPYFRRFRGVFFGLIQPRQVHVFHSRRSAFGRDDVLQENVILAGTRRDQWQQGAAGELKVTSSDGVEDMADSRRCTVDMGMAIDLQSADKVLRLPSSGEDKAVMRLVDAWPSSLQALRLSISTGPVVPFRAARHIRKTGDVPATHAPLLWMNHVRPLQATWPLATHKPQYIEREPAGLLLPKPKLRADPALQRERGASPADRGGAPCYHAANAAPWLGKPPELRSSPRRRAHRGRNLGLGHALQQQPARCLLPHHQRQHAGQCNRAAHHAVAGARRHRRVGPQREEGTRPHRRGGRPCAAPGSAEFEQFGPRFAPGVRLLYVGSMMQPQFKLTLIWRPPVLSERPTSFAERIGEMLFPLAFLLALGGWLPAISGYGWHLLGASGICLCGWLWIEGRASLRNHRRLQKELAAEEAVREAARRPLRRIVAAEREVLARQGRSAS